MAKLTAAQKKQEAQRKLGKIEEEAVRHMLYRQHLGAPLTTDGRRCEASVHDTYGVSFHQCGHPPKVVEYNHYWCRQHHKLLRNRVDEEASRA